MAKETGSSTATLGIDSEATVVALEGSYPLLPRLRYLPRCELSSVPTTWSVPSTWFVSQAETSKPFPYEHRGTGNHRAFQQTISRLEYAGAAS